MVSNKERTTHRISWGTAGTSRRVQCFMFVFVFGLKKAQCLWQPLSPLFRIAGYSRRNGSGSDGSKGNERNSKNALPHDGDDQARGGSKDTLKDPESSQRGSEDDKERVALHFNENDETKFIVYAHCLLAGSGVASSRVKPCLGAFAGFRPRSKSLYRDVLEVFEEGLRRFPSSPCLLYGASVTLQVSAVFELLEC